MNDLTAAHRTLPLGSWVQITNLENGRSIPVRVNDRGPFVAGRIIDVSYAAARALDMVGPGGQAQQLGAFADERNATALKARLDALTPGTYISAVTAGGQTLYRVRVGSYTSREAATRAAVRVAAHGMSVILMERD